MDEMVKKRSAVELLYINIDGTHYDKFTFTHCASFTKCIHNENIQI